MIFCFHGPKRPRFGRHLPKKILEDFAFLWEMSHFLDWQRLLDPQSISTQGLGSGVEAQFEAHVPQVLYSTFLLRAWFALVLLRGSCSSCCAPSAHSTHMMAQGFTEDRQKRCNIFKA